MTDAESGRIRVGLFVLNPEMNGSIARKLARCPDLLVVATASNFHDIGVAVARTEFDVSITGADSMEDAARFRSNPDYRPRFVSKRFFVTEKITPGQVVQGAHTGFDNYLLRDDPVETWLRTMRATLDGVSSLRKETVWEIAGDPVDLTALRFAERPEIEKQIVELVAEGLTNDQIAGILHISGQTVRNKICRLMDDVGVSNRTLLSLAYRRSPVEWRQVEL